MIRLPAADIRRAVRLGLEEDLMDGDVTTSSLFPTRIPACAYILTQQPLIVAGLAPAIQTFLTVDPSLELSLSGHDGDSAETGTRLLRI